MSSHKIEHTMMIGRKVRFVGNVTWEGVPLDYPDLINMTGHVMSVYFDPTSPRNPLYTVKMGDGRLIEADGGHIVDVDPSPPSDEGK